MRIFRFIKKRRRLVVGATVLIWILVAWRVRDQLHRSDAKAWDYYERAVRLLNSGRTSEAEVAIKKAIGYAQNDEPIFYRLLGVHYFRAHEYRKAIRCFEKMIELDQRFESTALAALAVSYASEGHIGKAIDTLERLRATYPQRFGPGASRVLAEYRREVNRKNIPGRVSMFLNAATPAGVLPGSPLWFGGNWDRDGKPTDAYGYAYTPVRPDSRGRYSLAVGLVPYSHLPYQVAVRDERRRPVGFSRFLVGADASNSQAGEINWSVADTNFFALKKESKLQRPKKSAKGEHRLFVLWLDCGSWWILRAGVERGIFPNSRDMIARGVHAEMVAIPPLTSYAMEKFTSLEPDFSVMNLLREQLKGLPFLDTYIPWQPNERVSLGSWLRKRGIRFVNLVFSDPHAWAPLDEAEAFGYQSKGGFAKQGHDQEKGLGPTGVMNEFLDAKEMRPFVRMYDPYGKWLIGTQWEETDQKLNLATAVFTGKDHPRALLVRIPSVDLLSHYFFENSEGFSASLRFLDAYYVFLDDRIGRLRAMLNSDDTLMVISDHGILNHVQHDTTALFFAEGYGIPAGVTINPFKLDRTSSIITSLLTEGTLPKDLTERP
jgi:hypothetical protein